MVSNAISASAENPFANITIPFKSTPINMCNLHSAERVVKADNLPNRTTQSISERNRSIFRAGKAATTPRNVIIKSRASSFMNHIFRSRRVKLLIRPRLIYRSTIKPASVNLRGCRQTGDLGSKNYVLI